MTEPAQSPRQQLMAQLEPRLPKDWKLIKWERNTDEISQVTVLVRQSGVSRPKPAIQGFYDTQSTLELIVPQTDPELAEDALDTALMDVFLPILEAIRPGLWDGNAKKVLHTDKQHMAYDVGVNYTTRRTDQ